MANQRAKIRENLMGYMKEAETDVPQLSQQTGVSKDTIRRLLNEKGPHTNWRPNADTIRRICHRFGIHPSQLHHSFLPRTVLE
jgi:transcriptional regulator with XRE-family HTH domain